VVNVANRANIHVRLGTLESFLCHFFAPVFLMKRKRV
jgi:hypothetical protein